MSLTGDFAGLNRLVKQMGDAARGKLEEQIKTEIAIEVERLARADVRNQQSAAGKPWAGKYGRLSLYKTGKLLRGLSVDVYPSGIQLSLTDENLKTTRGNSGRHGHTVGAVHQYGGRIWTKRLTYIGLRSGAEVYNPGFATERLRVKRLRPGLMRFLTAAGWRMAYETQMPRTPILPFSGTMPGRWGEALEGATKRVIAN